MLWLAALAFNPLQDREAATFMGPATGLDWQMATIPRCAGNNTSSDITQGLQRSMGQGSLRRGKVGQGARTCRNDRARGHVCTSC